MGIRRLALLCLFVSFSIISFAQKGTLKGLVTDLKTKEPLVGATIMLEGTTKGIITDFDGNYELPNIDPGTYTVRCSFISYETKLTENIVIKAGQPTELNVQLGESTVEIGDVKVVAKANRESESMLLVEQKNAVVATQAIGAQEISRKGASDAEAAVTKVSGISKQEGVKNVFVRGLGDRFNSTSLNGFPVPSEDPEYKNISLDFFGSDIIKAVNVSKVFDASMTGDVGGAEININSKELVGSSEFNVGVSASANTNTYNADFLLPDGVSSFGFAQNTESPTSGDTYSFANSLDPSSQDLQIGKGLSFSGGKRFSVGANKNPLNFYLIGNYSTDFSYTDGVTRQTTTTGTIYRDQTTTEYEKNSLHFATANVNYSFNKYDLTYNFLAIHSANQSLRDDLGLNTNSFTDDEAGNTGLVRRQQINDNTLLVNQLQLKKEINSRIAASAGVAYNYTNGKEPDRRVNYLASNGENIIQPLKGSGNQHRFFGDLKENDINALANVTYKLTDDSEKISSVEIGYRGRFLNDEYNASAWDNQWQTSNPPQLDLNDFSLDAIFNQEGFAAGKFANNNYKVLTYSVDKTIHSGYVLLNYQLTEKLIANLGVKVDKVDITVDYDLDLNDQSPAKSSPPIDELYLLPSLNLKYNLNDKNALRLGASKTYTLPQSKEISPMLYEGPQWASQGNEDLVPSTNYNVDLKWDYYMTPGELISITVFGKLIQDPISKVEIASANGYQSYGNIAEEAKLGGVEVEIRKDIFATGEETRKKLSTGINFSYIKTGVTLSNASGSLPLDFTNTKSELEGASPILANGDLSYQYKSNNFEFNSTVVANYFSDRIYAIGVGGYNDIEENGLVTLDFISSVKIKNHWGVSFKAKNLLDPDFELTRKPASEGAEPTVLRSYKKGINLSLGLSYEF
ncbi:TonB-dependent receptor [Mangrovibacterium diazotrophicum]|uniref:TonB-dependent receptor n=1 Tax=Mangrovibacterium diazotrophicum TaxID=1261403 RepID=A0A419W9M7_9BACT|nr:TonB-dependent receptor [Mangrovibacterium diazotrophicum]RKD92175.1 TonB-dependent receptor [Mangrovibacterium diazotrophicum]